MTLNKTHKVMLLIAGMLVLLVSVAVSASPRPVVQPNTLSPPTCSPDASQLLSLINQERAKIGSPALAVDAALATSAHNKLTDEITNRYYGHNLIDGSNDVSILRAQGINAMSSEDLDENALTPSEDWLAFKNSPAHYASLTDPRYTRVGLAEQCTNYSLAKETDAEGNVPTGTLIRELTVVHLAADEAKVQAQAPAPVNYVPKQQITTCFPPLAGLPATCYTR